MKSATLTDMSDQEHCAMCDAKFLSDKCKNFRRIDNKSVRVCNECYRKEIKENGTKQPTS